MGLHVWRSERADGLLGPLGDLLAEPAADPFAPEMIAVPTAGIERWLSQELALRLGAAAATGTDGVCANVEFPFPSRVITRALEAAGGLPDDSDVWRPDRLVWPLLAMAREEPDAGWWGPAAAHLSSPTDGRRFSAARILVDLFDRYAVHRPEMILAWADGKNVGPDPGDIPPSHEWQPELWRRLRQRVDTESTAERLAEATDRIAAGGVDLDLPERLSVFGLTALPASYLRVLDAIAAQRDVHLFLLHPSPALWDRVDAVLAGEQARRGPRANDPTDGVTQNPILSSWGRDAREMQLVFAALGAPSATHHPAPALPDPDDTDGLSLLARLQADIRADRRPDATDARPLLDPEDRSVQVHACHGRIRQVQVLRDAILHLLAEDPALEARDIIVMCPDVETFAPLVEAVFGAAPTSAGTSDHHEKGGATAKETEADGTPSLRVRLADRSIRQTNPVLKVVAELLNLADSRLTGPEVLDLLGRAPVRRRFRFDEDDLERLETWIADLGIRWGLDADDRLRFDLPELEANTWRAGLDRLLLGVAMADDDLRLVDDTLPYDDVEGTDVELAGRFAECIERLDRAARSLRDARGIDAWRDTIAGVADLLTATSESDAWMTQQLHRVLDEFVEHAEAGGDVATELTLAEVRVLLSDRLRGQPTRANHRTGDLTVCTLVPMRAVPHKVVCLLGMDDGSFPRRTAIDGDDLVDLVPFVGDRDPRTEDRQLLLDALLSAEDSLVVTYSGRDERTNEPLPPAVPLGELLDTIDATVRLEDGATDQHGKPATPRDRVVTEHPLQSFDARNYLPGALHPRDDRSWSFDTVALAGATAKRRGVEDPQPFVTGPLPPRPEDTDVVELDAIVRFLQHPTKAFLGQRLGVWFSSSGEGPEDGLPLDMSGLPKWGVGDRLLSARLAGHTYEQWERTERARGTLPPAPLDQPILDEVRGAVAGLLEAAETEVGDLATRSVELDLDLPDRRRLVGIVDRICGDTVTNIGFSKLKSAARLGAFARLVALTVDDPSVPWRAVALGQDKGKVQRCVLGPYPGDTEARRRAATDDLARIVDLYDRGMRQPPPLYPRTSEAIARAVAAGKSAWMASDDWETKYAGYGGNDDLDPCHIAVLGQVATFSDVLEVEPGPDDVGPDWEECEELIVAWALRLWRPVLALETAAARAEAAKAEANA